MSRPGKSKQIASLKQYRKNVIKRKNSLDEASAHLQASKYAEILGREIILRKLFTALFILSVVGNIIQVILCLIH